MEKNVTRCHLPRQRAIAAVGHRRCECSSHGRAQTTPDHVRLVDLNYVMEER